jgi:amino acid adenylation domain-containing protein
VNEIHIIPQADPLRTTTKLIHHLVEEQALRSPSAIAVEHGRNTLTYFELNRRANDLAHRLRSLGVGMDQFVALCMERSLELIIGVLGILKSGAAYLPLDPSYPPERLQYMVDDSAPSVMVTQTALRPILPKTTAKAIEVDRKLGGTIHRVLKNPSAEDLGLSPQNVIYVIYTSGSTGQPKGTAMRHGSMANLIDWHRRTLPTPVGHRVMQFAALSFDVAFQEIFSTLCAGGTLVLVDEWIRRDPPALLALLRSTAIQRLFAPPLVLQSLADCIIATSAAIPLSLLDIIAAGEQLRISREIRGTFKLLNRCRLHNHYGPTETHVVTTLTLSGDRDEWPESPSIGLALSNTQVRLLDPVGTPVPLGSVGEIYIGGRALARGYLRRPELTAQRFTADALGSEPGARLYRTGDFGKYTEDGLLTYLGRSDAQVKIRGFRVELGEIESLLAHHDDVAEAVVVAKPDASGDKRLVAYVKVRGENGASTEDLRRYLKSALPPYMVPSALMILKSWPLNPNGKLDRSALPEPIRAQYTNGEHQALQGEIENALARIWCDLLHLDQVGRYENFFELGGTSSTCMKLLVRVTERFSTQLSLPTVLKSPTLAEMAQLVKSTSSTTLRIVPSKGEIMEDIDL